MTSSLSKLRATCGELCAFVTLANETLLSNASDLDNMISAQCPRQPDLTVNLFPASPAVYAKRYAKALASRRPLGLTQYKYANTSNYAQDFTCGTFPQNLVS